MGTEDLHFIASLKNGFFISIRNANDTLHSPTNDPKLTRCLLNCYQRSVKLPKGTQEHTLMSYWAKLVLAKNNSNLPQTEPAQPFVLSAEVRT